MLSFAEILDSYYTAEDREKLEALSTELRELDAKYRKEHKKEFQDFFVAYKKGQTILVEEWKQEYFKARDRIHQDAKAINTAVLLKYKEEKKTEGILEDVRRIAQSYEKEDFQAHIKHIKDMLDLERFNIHLNGPDVEGKPYKHYLEASSEENYRNCFGWLYGNNVELEELLDGEDLYTAIEIFKARIDTFGYERPTEGVLSSKDQQQGPELPELPKYDFTYPTELQQNLTKASSKIFDSSIALSDLRQAEIDVTPNKKGGLTTYSVYVDMTAPELKGAENVTEYDKSVHNMAVSIGLSNKHGFFTARELATALIHGDNPNNNRVSSQQIGAVTKSIEKQRHIDITIDYTEHIKLNNKGNIPEDTTSFKIKDYMLPVRELTATIGGKTLHGYQFIDPVKLSPLYQYARSVGQLGQHPVKMLNVPINLDQQKLVIRDFLLEEIAHIKNPKIVWNNIIGVDRLLEVAGEDSQTITRKKKSILLSSVRDMLNYWKQEEYIKGYKENIKAKSIQSFTILT